MDEYIAREPDVRILKKPECGSCGHDVTEKSPETDEKQRIFHCSFCKKDLFEIDDGVWFDQS